MSDEIDAAQERDLMITTTTAEAAGDKARKALNMPGTKECDDCGGNIPAARRKAYPAARRCVDCQQRRERKVP